MVILPNNGYVLSIGAVFGIFTGVALWFPVILGVVFNNTLFTTQFVLIFIGVNITFFPQHFLGLNRIPRRYSDYPDIILGWNLVSTAGSIIRFFALMFFNFLLWESFSAKRVLLAVQAKRREWTPNPVTRHRYNQETIFLL